MTKSIVLYIIAVVTGIAVFVAEDLTKIYAYILLCKCYVSARKETDWYSPYYLINVTILSYILYVAQFGGVFMDELELRTKILILLCLTAVCVGFDFAKRVPNRPLNIGKKNESFLLCFIIGLLPTAISYYMFGNILDLDGVDLNEAKKEFTLPMISQLTYFLPASIVVACKRNDSKQIFTAVLFSFVAALFTVSKTAFLIIFLFWVVSVSKFQPSIAKSRVYRNIMKVKYLFVPVVLILLFMYNNNKRSANDGDNNLDIVERGVDLGGNNFAQNMFLNYCYYVQPWSNLNYNINYNKKRGTWGGNTLAQFGKKVGIEINVTEKIEPTFFNTHTFITDYYLDFGYLGAVIMSFFLGFFIYYCYIRFGLSDDPLLISFDILVSFATVMMFFSNHFNNGYLLNYLITFGAVSILARHVKNRSI